MKRFPYLAVLLALLCLLSGCSSPAPEAQVAATTLPVYEFTLWLCDGTDITVTRLVTESVSCLHDYSLNVGQVRAAENADVIVVSGAGLEAFLEDILEDKPRIDASTGIELICGGEEEHDHKHEHEGHSHGEDPHIWLSPAIAKVMAANICEGLSLRYPQYQDTFEANLSQLLRDLDALQHYGETQLQNLSCREIITFHDGFAYFAEAFGLTILAAVEEEPGAETSAKELKALIHLVREHDLPAIFTETNGADTSARIIAAETGAALFTLDMAMSGESYFDSMYRNIDTIKEALE